MKNKIKYIEIPTISNCGLRVIYIKIFYTFLLLSIMSCGAFKERPVSFEKINGKRILRNVQTNKLCTDVVVGRMQEYDIIFDVPCTKKSETYFVMKIYKHNGKLKKNYFITPKQYYLKPVVLKASKK